MTREDLDLIARFCDGITHHYDEDRARIRALLTAYEATQAERAASPPDAVRAAMVTRDVGRIIRCCATLIRASYDDGLSDDKRDGWRTIGADAKDSCDALATALLSVMAERDALAKSRDEWMAVAECSCITPAEDCDCSGCLTANTRAEEDSPDGR